MEARNFLLVGMGGAAGGGLRHALTLIPGAHYGISILLINVCGAFLLPIVGEYLLPRFGASRGLRLSITTGAIASFTTFSAITGEMVLRIHNGQHLWALGYVTLTFVLGLLAAAAAMALARRCRHDLNQDAT